LWFDFGNYVSSILPLVLENNQFIFYESVFIGKTMSLKMSANEETSIQWSGDEASYIFAR
jgi:hypothetical protein